VPKRRQVGSVSVWLSELDLRRFVGHPLHRAVIRRYRDRRTLTSVSWAGTYTDPTTAWLVSRDELARLTSTVDEPTVK
jgi:hypothetical protein